MFALLSLCKKQYRRVCVYVCVLTTPDKALIKEEQGYINKASVGLAFPAFKKVFTKAELVHKYSRFKVYQHDIMSLTIHSVELFQNL